MAWRVEEGCLEYKSILTVEERGGQKISPGYIVFEESVRYPNIKGRQKNGLRSFRLEDKRKNGFISRRGSSRYHCHRDIK